MTNFSWWWKQCDVAESSRNSKSIDLLLRQTSRRRLMVREVSSCRIIRQNNKINSWGEEKVPESPPARQTHTHDCNIKRRRRRSDLTCCLTCRASASLHDCFHIQLPSSPLCWSVVSCVGARARARTHTHTHIHTASCYTHTSVGLSLYFQGFTCFTLSVSLQLRDTEMA